MFLISGSIADCSQQCCAAMIQAEFFHNYRPDVKVFLRIRLQSGTFEPRARHGAETGGNENRPQDVRSQAADKGCGGLKNKAKNPGRPMPSGTFYTLSLHAAHIKPVFLHNFNFFRPRWMQKISSDRFHFSVRHSALRGRRARWYQTFPVWNRPLLPPEKINQSGKVQHGSADSAQPAGDDTPDFLLPDIGRQLSKLWTIHVAAAEPLIGAGPVFAARRPPSPQSSTCISMELLSF